MLFKNSLIYFISDITGRAVPFILLPVMTSFLDPSDYGIVASFNAFGALALMFITLNTSGLVEISYFREEADYVKSLVTNIFILFCLMVVILSGVLYLVESFIVPLFDVPFIWLLLGVIMLGFKSFGNVLLMIWRFERKAFSYAIFELIQTVFLFILSVILVVFFNWNWTGRLVPQIGVTVVFGGIGIFIVRKKGYISIALKRFGPLKDALKYGLPLLPHSISGWLKTGLDKLLITNLVGISETGVYAVAYQLGTVVTLVAAAINKALLPYLYQMISENRDNLKLVRYTSYYFIFIIISGVLLYFLMDVFLIYIINNKFISAKSVLPYVVVAYIFDSLYLAVVPYLFYWKSTGVISVITVLTSLVHIPLSYVFITKYGIEGAAIASMITYAMTFFITWCISQKRHPLPWSSLFIFNG